MCVKQEDLFGEELFLFKGNRLICCIEGCQWSIDCECEDPLEKFIEHINIEHLGLSRELKH